MSRIRFRPSTLLISLALSAPAVADGFRDEFDDPSSGWPDNSTTAYKELGLGMYTETGAYQMTPIEDNVLGVSLAPQQSRSPDVRLDTEVLLYAGIGAGGAGLVCRFQDFKNFYAFLAIGSGGYAIVRMENGESTRLASGPLPPQLVENTVDVKLGAECNGDELTLKVDGRTKATVRDARFASGASGLAVVGEKLAGTHARFENFALTSLSDRVAQADRAVTRTPEAPRQPRPQPRAESSAPSAPAQRDATPAPVGDLGPREALVVVEDGGFQWQAKIAVTFDELVVARQGTARPAGERNVLAHVFEHNRLRIGLKPDPVARTVAGWWIEADLQSGQLRCSRVESIYEGQVGRMQVLNGSGREVCRL